MHLGARGFVHAELVDPETGASVELERDVSPDPSLAEAIREKVRNVLVVQTRVELVPWGSLRRSEYKTQLVERR